MSRRGSMRWAGRKARLHYQYDKDIDVLTVEGQRYSGDFFRHIAEIDEEGIMLMAIRKETGVVVFERVDN